MKFNQKLVILMTTLLLSTGAFATKTTDDLLYKDIETFPKLATSVRSKFEYAVNRSTRAFSWIWTKGRKQTGNETWFFGDASYLWWHHNGRAANGADRSFGYVLFYLYDGYCNIRGLKNGCLGHDMKVTHYISGYSADNVSIGITVQYKGKKYQRFSRSVRQAQMQFWDVLNTISPSPYKVETAAALSTKYIPVHLRLLSLNSADYLHFGNPNWLAKFNKKLNLYAPNGYGFVIKEVSRLTGNSNQNLGKKNLWPLLETYGSNYGRTGWITATVSPTVDTQNFWGMSYIKYTQKVHFTMSQWAKYDASTINEDAKIDHLARIFIHEMGHNMDLQHTGAINADNFYKENNPSGRNLYKGWAQSMTTMLRY
ncbi:hypothetical protein BS333_18865 [Vibrio azureus]|uniref:Peptidase M10 metallopeptidase domain-containing protein n=1 Tax=Vibrio azureus NBRC 104587 TaxID=1219077 RepID=U3AX95_9VIBR|nr:hypothetical protein [Vibrio azureus]AUI88392.1 hypothetical protein BS333_18865 [Vibrio azureus]GAD77837.1 hypothetical protein VAZ01S_095_00110 [Vibrio azureus NBRC 104587]